MLITSRGSRARKHVVIVIIDDDNGGARRGGEINQRGNQIKVERRSDKRKCCGISGNSICGKWRNSEKIGIAREISMA